MAGQKKDNNFCEYLPLLYSYVYVFYKQNELEWRPS